MEFWCLPKFKIISKVSTMDKGLGAVIGSWLVGCVLWFATCGFVCGDEVEISWEAYEKVSEERKTMKQIQILSGLKEAELEKGNLGEAGKALTLLVEAKVNRDGGVEKTLEWIDEELEGLPEELAAVVWALRGEWLAGALESGRFLRFDRNQVADELAVADPNNFDVTTWSRQRIFREMVKSYLQSLALLEQFGQLEIEGMKPLFGESFLAVGGEVTLYEALTYRLVERIGGLVEVRDEFRILVEGAGLAEREAFLAWQVPAGVLDGEVGDALWFGWQDGVKLWQRLLRNLDERELGGERILFADVERLTWMRRAALGDEGAKRAKWRQGIQQIIEVAGEREVANYARYQLAIDCFRAGEWLEAHELALRGADNSARLEITVGCLELIAMIEAKELDVVSRRQWLEGRALAKVKVRNLERVHARIYRAEWEPGAASRGRVGDILREEAKLNRLLRSEPLMSWSFETKAEERFAMRELAIEAPEIVPYGYFYLVLSEGEDFATESNNLRIGEFYRSDEVVILRGEGVGGTSGLLVDLLNGGPLAGRAIEAMDVRSRELVDPVVSDDDGYFELGISGQIEAWHRAENGGIAVMAGFQRSHRREQSKQKNVIFFTDRQAYRPGQTVRFKGIVTERRQVGERRTLVAAGEKITVALVGANRERLEEIELETNEFGSLSGEFQLPTVGLLGRFTLSAEGIQGGVSFLVEEYKRPVFSAGMDVKTAAAVIGDEVVMEASARGTSGEPMDGAKVRWRVSRSPRWRPAGNVRGAFLEAQQIASGEGVTSADGQLSFEFKALADPNLELGPNSSYHYSVEAEVVAPSGESQFVRWSGVVNYSDYQPRLEVGDWLISGEEMVLTLRAIGVTGEPLVRGGTLVIDELEQASEMVDWFTAKRGDVLGEQQRAGREVKRVELETDKETGEVKVNLALPAGEYDLRFEGQDGGGRQVETGRRIAVFDIDAMRCGIKQPQILKVEQAVVEPGDTWRLLWASGYEEARACVEFFRDGELLRRVWTAEGRSQQVIELEIEESMRGGVSVNVVQFAEGKLHTQQMRITVPWSNKQFDVSWQRISSLLEPGAKDTWIAKIKLADGQPATMVEWVGGLYDASLDLLFGQHSWPSGVHWHDLDVTNLLRWSSASSELSLMVTRRSGHYTGNGINEIVLYPEFGHRFPDYARYRYGGFRGGAPMRDVGGFDGPFGGVGPFGAPPVAMEAAAASGEGSDPFGGDDGAARGKAQNLGDERPQAGDAAGGVNDQALSGVRKNLQETAFFYPNLRSNGRGEVEMSFTLPEALTKWRFLGFGHDKLLRYGSLEGEAMSRLEVMIRPNAPRFVRVGDVIEFSARVVNTGAMEAAAKVGLELRQAGTGQGLSEKFGVNGLQELNVPAGQSRVVKWRLSVPEMNDWVIYRATVEAELKDEAGKVVKTIGDGEENWLPILPSKVIVREAATMVMRGGGEVNLELTDLLSSEEGGDLVNVGYSVEAVSRPAWLAVKSLPYLMEYPHQCSEQIFNRFYANALARHLVLTNPGIKEIFGLWRKQAAELEEGGGPLTSELQRNQEMKSVMVEETPFLTDAKDERSQRGRLANLFDDNRVQQELERAMGELGRAQLENGAWPWFSGAGARENFYITGYITAGFGRLRALGVEPVDLRLPLKACGYLDEEMRRRFLEIENKFKAGGRDGKADAKPVLSAEVVLYLFARSYFLQEQSLDQRYRLSFDFWLNLAVENWGTLESLALRAQLALALNRSGREEVAAVIVESLREHALTSEDLGMHWRQLDRGGLWWGEAPIESQAVIVEAFEEIAADLDAARECLVWLVQQKRTQHWRSTKASADAIYAILKGFGQELLGGVDADRGDSQLNDLMLQIGDRDEIKSSDAGELGTANFSVRLASDDIVAKDGRVKGRLEGEGMAWVNVFWQSLRPLESVASQNMEGVDGADATLAIEKTLFVERTTDDGVRIEPLGQGEPLKVGDTLVTRLILRNDRRLEFMHLKDMRGAGCEPIDAISGYRWSNDVFYYQSSRDTATHFFIERLDAGSRVIEYRVKIQHAGEYQSGFAEFECLYAPEFRARSGAISLKVLD